MANAGQIPMSNKAGNNQFSPTVPTAGPVAPHFPGSTVAPPTSNPYNPPAHLLPGASSPGGIPFGTPTPTGGPSVPNTGGLINDPSNVYGTTGALDKQLKDIWGKGVGGALGDLLKNMSGTDSATLQEFIKSLQPEMAKASANVGASLGASGVGPNSSVNAIAQADLQSQEFAAISGESAKLTQSQEMLTAEILQSMMNPAAKEVATSGWSVFADVMNNITGDIGNLFGGNFHNTTNAPTDAPAFNAPQLGGLNSPAPDASGVQSYADSLSYSSMDMTPFGTGDSIPGFSGFGIGDA